MLMKKKKKRLSKEELPYMSHLIMAEWWCCEEKIKSATGTKEGSMKDSGLD